MALIDIFYTSMLCICGLTGHVLLTRAYQVYDASKLAPFHYLEIVAGYFLDIVFLGNRPDLLSIIGTVMIISIGFMLSHQAKEPKKDKDESE
jgi:drug/metabolite transporter (DMT)-like permease